jgi:chromosome segregation ATPase
MYPIINSIFKKKGRFMSTERLRAAEQNIYQIRDSVQNLRVEEARQTEQLVSIRDASVRHDGQFKDIQCQFRDINSTMAAISSTMHEMQSTMATMSATLSVNTESLKQHMRRTEQLENRVSPLEKFQYKMIGGFLAASAVGGLLASFATKWFL